MSTPWVLSHRCDPDARVLADRHYNRQSIGAKNFAPPGRCLVMKTYPTDAFWVTSWPFAEYVRHDWAGAWVCSAFRNEGSHLSSELIRFAIAHTRARWEPPELGMITFVDRSKTRQKKNPGYCYLMAGFEPVGYTKGGLVALQILPDAMPDPVPLLELQGAFSFAPADPPREPEA